VDKGFGGVFDFGVGKRKELENIIILRRLLFKAAS